MKLIRYLLGKSQFVPAWIEKLPLFMYPVYQGDEKFKWFGIVFDVPDAYGGDTLFMYWRRKILKRS